MVENGISMNERVNQRKGDVSLKYNNLKGYVGGRCHYCSTVAVVEEKRDSIRDLRHK